MTESKLDILVEVDYSRDEPIIWYYFRGCPEILVHIRPCNDMTVVVEHMQQDSYDELTKECDGPELHIEDNSLFDMICAGVKDAIIGTDYAGAEAIYIDELPKSSQDFIINYLHLGEYVVWTNKEDK